MKIQSKKAAGNGNEAAIEKPQRRGSEAKPMRFTKAAAWAWFEAYDMPCEMKPREAKERSTDESTYRCAFRLMQDHLVVGVWRSHRAEPVGCYYMTARGLHYARIVDQTEWDSRRLCYITIKKWDYWDSHKTNHDRFEVESIEEGVEDWLTTVNSEYGSPGYDKPVAQIASIERYGEWRRRTNARDRKIKKITAWAQDAPPLPDDWNAWVSGTVFGGVHYQFYRKDDKAFGCSVCGHETPENNVPAGERWKKGQTVTCPSCGTICKVFRNGDEDRVMKEQRAMICQRYEDMQGEPCLLITHMIVAKSWKIGVELIFTEPHIMITRTYREIPRMDGFTRQRMSFYYENGNGAWEDKNPCIYTESACYCYPDMSAIKGTPYDGLGLEVAAARGWRLYYNNLMRYYNEDRRIEYLIKGGFERLVYEIGSGVNGICALLHNPKDGRASAAAILGLDGQGVARLRQHNGGKWHLEWLRACTGCNMRTNLITGEKKMVNERISDDTWDFLAKHRVSPGDCYKMMSRVYGGLSVEQVAHYIAKQEKLLKGKTLLQDVATMWRDTLDMSESEGLDFSKDMVVRPRDLKARHDELVEIIHEKKDRKRLEEIEKEFPEVRPTCNRIRAVYEYGDERHMVVVPTGVADIGREGRLLGHCVAANERYYDRIAAGESYILFLRRAREPEKPWYTMEVEPGGRIRQLRTMGDNEGERAERDEAKAFLREWSRVVRARCSEAELKAAEVAREKRLRNFDELRENGNIIRNGVLKGCLLADILERDFRELNEPEYGESHEAAAMVGT